MRPALRRLLLAASALLVAGSAQGAPLGAAASPSPAELDAIVAPFVADQSFSGAILIVRDRQILFDRAYGFADLGARIPNATSTSFHIGSLSAQFTRAAIEQLVAKQHLDWANTADQFVSGAPHVTIRGLVDTDPATTDGRAAYRLLTRIAESVTAKSFSDVVDAAVFGPLWLTGAGLDDGTAAARSIAKGYVRNAGGVVPAAPVNWAARTGEGAAYLTTRDEFAWIQKRYADMAACQAPDWDGGAAAGPCVAASQGDGFATYVAFAPAHLAVIVLSNVEGNGAAELGRALSDQFSAR